MKYFVGCALVILAAASCQKAVEEGGAALKTFEITASCDEVTRTELASSNGAVNWLAGDEIAVFTRSGERYTMTAQSSGSNVKFRGELPDGTSSICAVYPSSAAVSCSQGVITAALPSSQEAVPAGFQNGLVLCTAAGDVSSPSNDLQFKNVCGLVKFAVGGSDVKRVKIVGASSSDAITGKTEITAATGVSSALSAGNTVEMIPPPGSTFFAPGKDCYFAALPGTINGFTMYYECESGIRSRKTAKPLTITRSGITAISGDETQSGWASDAIVLNELASTSSTVTLGWTFTGSADPSRDYTVYAYSDASCKSPVYAFTLASAKFKSNPPRFIFTGLDPGRTYCFKVRDDASGHYSSAVAATTASFSPVEIGTESVKEGGILLAEDFSQLVYGGDCLTGACGYAPSAIAVGKTDCKYTVSSLAKASGENPEGFMTETSDRQYTMGLQLGVAIRDDSRLGGWLYQASTNTYNRAMCRAGYIGISNNATNPGYLITPALTNMKDVGSIKVTFKAAACGTTDCKVGIASPSEIVASTGTPKYGYGAVTKGAVEVEKSFVLTSSWEEYSLTIDDVAPGSRIAFGTDAESAEKVPFILLDDIRISVESYASTGTLPDWHTGMMDIHFLSSWSGESLFIVYPDGTTMVIDAAGDDSSTNNPLIRAQWESEKPGVTNQSGTSLICNYIRHFLDKMGKSGIDYVMLTHYHPDHMGTYHSTSYTGYTVKKTSRPIGEGSAKWTLNGITMLLEEFQVGKYVDRDYSPDASLTHSYPMQLYVKKSSTLKGQTSTRYPVEGNTSQGYVSLSMMNNYRYMIRSIEDNGWTSVERYEAGSDTQFKPLYDSSCGVEVRNLGAGGVFWTGSGTSVSQRFPTGGDIEYVVPEDGESIDKNGTYGHNCPSENGNSCCLRFTWGRFTFGTLGDNCHSDCNSYAWKDAEQPIADHIGQCDVMKANHHGIEGTGSSALANATSPQVWVVDNWNDSQGDKGPVGRLPSDTRLYFTNMTSTIRSELSAYSSRIADRTGHVVVRAYDNGDKFKVYVLDRNDDDYKVLLQSGAYRSR